MRGKTAKRLRKFAVKLTGGQSEQFQYPDGSVRWVGAIRKYRDLKYEWKNCNIFEKGVFFNGK